MTRNQVGALGLFGAMLVLVACESPTSSPSPPVTPPRPPVVAETPNVVLAGPDSLQGRRGAHEDGTLRVECEVDLTMYADSAGVTGARWSGGRYRWYDLSTGALTTVHNLSEYDARSFWGKASIGSGEFRVVRWVFWDEQPFRLEVEFYYGHPGQAQSTASYTLRCHTPAPYTARGTVTEWPHTLGKAQGVLVSVGDKTVKTDTNGGFIIPDMPWNQRTFRFESPRHSSTPEPNSWGTPENMQVYLARLTPKMTGFLSNTVGGSPEQAWELQEVSWYNPGGADKLPNEATVILKGPGFSGTVVSIESVAIDANQRRYTFKVPAYVATEASFSITNTAKYTAEAVCSRLNPRELYAWRCKEPEY